MITIRRSSKNGQSLIEMALLLPVLLLITVVTLDIGRAIYYYSAIYNAAREGARYAIVNQCQLDDNTCNSCEIRDEEEIKNQASKYLVGLDASKITFVPPPQLTDYSDEIDDCTKVLVTVNYEFQVITPIANLFINNGGSITLSSSSEMFIER